MSVVRPTPTTPGAFICPRCGNALHADQSWCLECGLAARSRVHPPPNWRLPILATCLALVLLATGIAFGLVALLDDPETTPAPTTVTVPAAAPAAATPAATTPVTTTPAATVPATPTTPTTTVPGATTPTTPTATTPTTTTPAPSGRQRTFTIPGTGIELPANG